MALHFFADCPKRVNFAAGFQVIHRGSPQVMNKQSVFQVEKKKRSNSKKSSNVESVGNLSESTRKSSSHSTTNAQANHQVSSRNETAKSSITLASTPPVSPASSKMDPFQSSPAAPIPASDVLTVSQVSNICASSSHGLGAINERHSYEDDARNPQADADAASRTSSSCSMPDYLCHKLRLSLSNSQQNSKLNVESDSQQHLKPLRSPAVSSLTPEIKVKQSSSASRIVKESCDSSTSTTTSESYQLSDLPPLPAKLATLNKPSNQALLATALRSRKARHSIDVRALPSYLAKKRQSTFGQFLSGQF